jgi:hypothetical protein
VCPLTLSVVVSLFSLAAFLSVHSFLRASNITMLYTIPPCTTFNDSIIITGASQRVLHRHRHDECRPHVLRRARCFKRRRVGARSRGARARRRRHLLQ